MLVFEKSKQLSLSSIIIGNFEYDLLQEKDIKGMVECVINSFALYDPLSKAVNLTQNDLRIFIEDGILDDCMRSKNSIVVRDIEKKQIAGAMLISDFADETELNISLMPENFLPILHILSELEGKLMKDYEIGKGTLLHGIMAGVSKEYMNKGLIKNMLGKAYLHAVAGNYEGAFSEATGIVSQKVASKIGAKTLYEIDYASFAINKTYPFKSIKEEGKCKLMLIDLKN